MNYSILLSAILALCTGIFLLYTGKTGSFLLINGNHHEYADFFFKYYTYAGDGGMWALVTLLCIFFRKKYLAAVIAGIIISTLLTQFMKRVIYPEELRPVPYLAQHFPVHIVEGIKINRLHSFPSGHTSAAFTMAILGSLMINKRSWSVLLPLLALLVGYSRVYLAQHFVNDVFFGIIVGIISAVLSVLFYQWVNKRKTASRT